MANESNPLATKGGRLGLYLDVLCGDQVGTGTLITIPANRAWRGQITLQVTTTHTAATTASIAVTTPNTAGVFPQNAAVARIAAAAGANGSGANSVTFDVYVDNTTTSPIALTSTLTAGAGTTAGSATANGVLV